ncbi:MAG TPA: thiamine-phosphate kinase [Thermodesulfobacteriota bacterium]|nr:thiamine-phosphate kinase [Thermodesulfobacteriota bacterium]
MPERGPERVTDIGEFGLIRRIGDLVNREGVRSERVTLGIGDDTASFVPRPGYELLVTCDCVVEGRHYLPGKISPLDLGRRAMTLNISDIGAMGGRPLYALISLGLKGDILVQDVEEMYRGFLAELNPFGASIIGGNLTKSGNGMFIDITLIGEVEQGRGVRRSGARPGDVILVTGYPGQAAAGLQLLLRGADDPNILEHPLVKIFNTPSHRARVGETIAKTGLATAMIDTSDGFLGDLGHICEESGVGAELSKEKLPLSDDLREAALRLHRDPYDLFLGDSDDYELVITCRPQDMAPLRSILVQSCPVLLTEVGRITDAASEITLLLSDGGRRPVQRSGWDHFRLTNESKM